MTHDRMALIALIEKAGDTDLLGYAAERMIRLEVEAPTGVPAGQRGPERLTQRNRYRDRA